MSEDQKQGLQYQISLNSFKDEISHKMMLIQKMQYQLNNKLKLKTLRNNQATCEVVKACRKNIQEIQRIFVDIKSYFFDLKIQFVYELIANIFKVLILSFKVLSQKFIITLKQKKKQQCLESEATFNKNTQRLIEAFKNKDISQIQYLDSLIKNIQQDQKRLEKKKRLAEQDILFQRDQIQNINPSDAANQLQTLRRQLDRIISFSQKLSDEGSQYRNQQNFKFLKSLKSPQDIQGQYCTNISFNTKEIFIINMNKVAKRLHLQIKENQKQLILQQIVSQRPQMTSKYTQTSELDIKTKTDNLKDKSVLIMQNDQLRKANSGLKKQLNQLKNQIQKVEEQHKQLQKKNQIANEMYNRKMLQLQKAKCEFQYSLSKKQQTIEALNKKISDIKSQRTSSWVQSHIETPTNNQNTNLQVSVNQDVNELQDILSSKFKITGKERAHHVSFYYERQFKLQRQQNNHLRKSLTIMLDALRQQKLILQYPINDLNNDLRLGKLITKIEAISLQLLKKVKEIKLKDQKSDQIITRTISKKKTTIIPLNGNSNQQRFKKNNTQRIHVQTQTIENLKQTSPILNQNTQATLKLQKENIQEKKDNKLQILKQEFINRVNSGKKESKSTNRSRIYANDTQKKLNKANISFQSIKPIPQPQIQGKNSKNAVIFNRKDISFEQFKISPPQQNKAQYVQKRILHKAKRSHQNFKVALTQNCTSNLNTKRRLNNRSYQNPISGQPQSQTQNLLQIHKLQSDNQVNKIIQMIQSKNQFKETKSQELKRFIRKILQQIHRIKGTHFVQQLLKQESKKLIIHQTQIDKIKTPPIYQL